MVFFDASVGANSSLSRYEDGDRDRMGDQDGYQDGDQDGYQDGDQDGDQDRDQDEDSGSDMASDDPITGACFNNDVYHLTVGPARHVFVVHQPILAQSPVLACMTKSSFSEGITKQINLPEDDADQFGRLIKYLYGNHLDAFNFDLSENSVQVHKLADMYALAEKYQLPDMQIDITHILEMMHIDWSTFFQTACHICQHTRDSDEIFRNYFTREAAKHLRSDPEDEKLQDLSEMVEYGGSFAGMAFQVLAKVYRDDKSKWSVKQSLTEDKVRDTRQNLQMIKGNLKHRHLLQHPECTRCMRG